MAEKGNSIHAGHRRRTRAEFIERGLNGMADHRALELLLFYAIPQGDVNPLAHRLLDHFGSLTAVFHATYEELTKVPGVGEHTATLIRLVPAIAARYMERRAEVGDQLLTTWQFRELLLPLFFGAREERAYLVCMDGKNKLIGCRHLGDGIIDQVAIINRKVMEVAMACNASRVALAHNHVSGVATFSAADRQSTHTLRRLLRQVEVELIDHFVVADDEMVSMAASGYLNEDRERAWFRD